MTIPVVVFWATSVSQTLNVEKWGAGSGCLYSALGGNECFLGSMSG